MSARSRKELICKGVTHARKNANRWAHPTSGSNTTMTVVELDRKGRVLLPASLRRKLGTKRFEVRLVDGRVELVPLETWRSLKGKYRNRLRTPWPTLEEKAENFVSASKR